MARHKLMVGTIDEVSSVTKGANRKADVLFYKSAEGGGKTAESEHRGTVAKVKDAVRDALVELFGDDVTKDAATKEEAMAEFDKSSLSPEAAAYVEGLEEEVRTMSSVKKDDDKTTPKGKPDDEDATDGEEDEDEEEEAEEEDVEKILKNADPATRRVFAKMQESLKEAKANAAEATSIAKAERRQRERSDAIAFAKSELKHLPGTDEAVQGGVRGGVGGPAVLPVRRHHHRLDHRAGHPAVMTGPRQGVGVRRWR